VARTKAPKASERPGRTVGTTDADDPDDDADDRRPKGEEEQQPSSCGVRIGIGPKTAGRSDDYEHQRAGAEQEECDTNSHPKGLEIGAHAA
jgi:hypothetical protein